MSIPNSIPRCGPLSSFSKDPLNFLRGARQQYGDIVVIAEGVPFFSRATECAASIAVFGEELTRRILTDVDTFEMPVSVSDRYSLPEPLKNLNSGLFSMRGDRHRHLRRLMAPILSTADTALDRDQATKACERFFAKWPSGSMTDLSNQMRRFALCISETLLMGEGEGGDTSVGARIQRFFDLRREYAAGQGSCPSLRRELIHHGEGVDRALRGRVRQLASDRQEGKGCVVKNIMEAALENGAPLDEDETIAHANILFMASSEPIATTLMWAVLLLTQKPELRRNLRREFSQFCTRSPAPGMRQMSQAVLLDGVVLEILRLVPPSAMLVRLARKSCRLAGYELPPQCEFVVSPFVEHRDSRYFEAPDQFQPYRWLSSRPRPFQFLPFGGGGRSCLGRQSAIYTIKLGIQQLLTRLDLVLAADQQIDWQINLTLLPSPNPTVVSNYSEVGGVLRGGAADILGIFRDD